MSYDSSELICPYCHTKLTGQETDFIQRGTTVRCRECGTLLTKDMLESTGGALIDLPISPQGSISPGYQPPPRRGAGAIFFFIGFIILSLGLYSWVFYIPIFNEFIYGEILGAVAVVKGLSDLRKEAVNPSAIRIMALGLLLWIGAWLSWFIYIPILSDAFIGEFSGLGLIIFGYLKSR